MKAAVLTAPYEITVEKRGMPQIQGPQDVLFKILQTGICGSDMLAFRGGHKTVQYPRVLGHECVGEVVAVGYEAEEISPRRSRYSTASVDLRYLLSVPARQNQRLHPQEIYGY